MLIDYCYIIESPVGRDQRDRLLPPSLAKPVWTSWPSTLAAESEMCRLSQLTLI